MSMQKLISSGLLVALILAGQSSRGEDGRLSQDTLQQMGLGGLVAMSDTEAESVRGLGFYGGGSGSHGSWAEASGKSFATLASRYGSAHSENSYSSKGKHEASGENYSHAGAEVTRTHGSHGHDNYGGNGNGNGGCGNRGCAGGGNSHPHGGSGNGNCHTGGGSGNGYCRSGGARTTCASVKVFAGGSSSARAH